MRPEHIELKNIGPYKDCSIDFLNLDNLFLIYGSTGSGKTFIFDAMTYALYGSLQTGHDGRQSEFRSKYSNLTDEAYIKFSFSIGKEHFRVTRQLPYLRQNKKNCGLKEEGAKALLEKWNEKKSFFETTELNKNDQISKFIEKLIGLSKEEFSKLIVLPQGEFAQFLHQKGADKQKTLEKLFPVSSFKGVLEEIKEKTKLAKEEIDSIQKVIESLRENIDVSDAENRIQQLKKIQKDTDKKLIELKKENDLLIKKESEIENEINEAIVYEKAIEQKKNLESKKQIIQEYIEKLEKHKLAINLYKDLQILNGYKNQYKVLNEENEKCQKDLKTASENKNIIESKKEEQLLRNQKIEELKVLKTNLRSKIENAEKLKIKRNELKSFIEKKNNAETQMMNFSIENKKLELSFNELASEFKVNFIDEEEMISKLKDLRRDIEKEIEKYEEKIKEKIEKENLKKEKILEEKNLKFIENQLSILEENINLFENTIKENQAALFASTLKKGESCPVCGSKEHPFPAKILECHKNFSFEKIQDSLKEQREREKSLRDEKSKITQILCNLNEKIGSMTYKESLDDLKIGLKEKKAILEKLSDSIKKSEDISINIKKNKNLIQEKLLFINESKGNITSLEKYISETEKEIFCEENNSDTDFIHDESDKNRNLEVNQKKLQQHLNECIIEIDKLISCSNEYEKNLNENQKLLIHFESKHKEQKKHLEEIQKKLEEAEKNFLKEKNKSLFSNENEIISAVLTENLEEQYNKDIENFKKNQTENETVLKNRQYNKKSSTLSQEFSVIKKQLALINEEQTNLQNKKQSIFSELSTLESTWKQIVKKENQLISLNEDFKVLSQLNQDFNGKNKVNFDSWALSMYFEEVLNYANTRFDELSDGRYQFKLGKGVRQNSGVKGLDISVVDSYNGLERDASTLSGGETFEASISLALGLTDAVQARSGGIKLDSLFIDEGFGTLDTGTLEKAIKILSEIGESKMVGIITHVDSFRQIVKSGIKVNKSSNGSSIKMIFDGTF